LGDFTDPALIRRGLDYVLTAEVRTQNAAKYLSEFFGNPAANALAWAFFKQHWSELQPRLSASFSDVAVVRSLGSFCDAGTRDDIKAFFAMHRLGSAARNVDQALERIDNCIRLK